MRNFFNRAKGNGCDLKAINGEIQFTLKCGSDMNIIAALSEVTDPVGGNGGAGIDDVKDLHDVEIIRHCPNCRDAVYLSDPAIVAVVPDHSTVIIMMLDIVAPHIDPRL